MAYKTDKRGYPVAEYDDTRWDVQIQESMEMLDDDVTKALNQSGGSTQSVSWKDIKNVPQKFRPKDHGDGAHTKNYAETSQLFSKNYNDLTNTPSLFSGKYSDLSGKPSLFSGKYSDLSGVPSQFSPKPHDDTAHTKDYATVSQTFSGNYSDLTNKPSLFSGNYNDLSNKPSISVGSGLTSVVFQISLHRKTTVILLTRRIMLKHHSYLAVNTVI